MTSMQRLSTLLIISSALTLQAWADLEVYPWNDAHQAEGLLRSGLGNDDTWFDIVPNTFKSHGHAPEEPLDI